MDGYIWGIFVPVMWVGVWGLRSHFRHRQRLAEIQAMGGQNPPGAVADHSAQEEELRTLRERVKVLERIVVERNTTGRHADALAEEIETLR